MDFVTKFNMRDEFLTWFLISELHAWMLMVRGMAEEKHPVNIRDGVNKLLWQDTIQRIKPLELDRKQMYRALETYGAEYTYAIVAYDEGLYDDRVLASALWNRFFQKECESFEHLDLMVKYIRLNVRMHLDFISAPVRRTSFGSFCQNWQ